MNSPAFPIGYPWLKVYIAHRQTCPNCSSSCYANDHICYDSARRGSSSTTVSCRSAVETLRSTRSCARKGACFIQRYVAVRAAYTVAPRLDWHVFSRGQRRSACQRCTFSYADDAFSRLGRYTGTLRRTCETYGLRAVGSFIPRSYDGTPHRP